MSEAVPRSRMERAKDLWWVWGVLMFLAGSSVTGFLKYTGWYIDEQNRATTLKALSTNSELMSDRLKAIDATLLNQKYFDQDIAAARQDHADHLHALDGRADTNRDAVAELHEQLATQKERLLYLLDPKARK